MTNIQNWNLETEPEFKTDPENGILYRKHGEVYRPVLEMETDGAPIGTFGRMRREYLRKTDPIELDRLTATGELYPYLRAIEVRAGALMDRLMEQMAKDEGVNEELKANNQMEWVGQMNNIRYRAEEIVRKELIYV